MPTLPSRSFVSTTSRISDSISYFPSMFNESSVFLRRNITLKNIPDGPLFLLCQLSFNKSKYLQNGGKNYEYDSTASFVDMVVKKNVKKAIGRTLKMLQLLFTISLTAGGVVNQYTTSNLSQYKLEILPCHLLKIVSNNYSSSLKNQRTL